MHPTFKFVGLLALFATASANMKEITDLPGFGAPLTRNYAGHITVNATCEAKLFFWLVESQGDPSKDPLVIWFNGGPGSSSFLGFFLENGPYKIEGNNTDVKLKANPFGWNKNANYVMVDQPAGTGLSFTRNDSCLAATEGLALDQLYTGIRMLLSEENLPQFAKLPFFIFSESYGGHYVPELATRILAGNGAGMTPKVNLKGIGVGDGWVNPLVANSAYSEYAYSHGLIDLAQKEHVDALYADCSKAIIASLPTPSREADVICNKMEDFISQANVSGAVNVLDVRKFEDYDFDSVGAYLNHPDVRQALNLDKGCPAWSPSSDKVSCAFHCRLSFLFFYLFLDR
jgi:carboxypeptidase C (cathepsin A)